MTITIGKRSGNAIVPYSQTTKKTKKYAITVTESTANNYSDVDSWAIAYADSNDNWFLHFHIHGTKDNNTTSTTLAITGITFASESDTPLTVLGSSVGYASKNTSNVVSGTLSSAASTLYIDGLVALESEPTWAAANLEASTNASIYIEPASASQAGLLDNNAQAVDGVKTFNDGVKPSSGSDALTDYDEYEVASFDFNAFGTQDIKIVKIGSTVTFTTKGALPNAATSAESASNFPAKYRPFADTWFRMSDSRTEGWSILIGSSGLVTIYTDDNAGGSISRAPSAFSVTWNVW